MTIRLRVNGVQRSFDQPEDSRLLDVLRTSLGLTSVAKQQQMNVSEPAYGWLLEGSQVEVGTALACRELIQPRCEPEIAFLVGRDLEGPDVTATDVLVATEAVMPAIDVLDSRYAGYSFTLPAVVADNISSARYALGAPVPATGIDLRLVGCLYTERQRRTHGQRQARKNVPHAQPSLTRPRSLSTSRVAS